MNLEIHTRIAPSELFQQVWANNYPAICTGPVPRDIFPPLAGSFPWVRYETLQSLCVGSPLKLVQGSYDEPSMWCRCPNKISDRISEQVEPTKFMLCSVVDEWGDRPQSARLWEYCFRHCSCNGAPKRPFGATTLEIWAATKGMGGGYTEFFYKHTPGDDEGEWWGERGQYPELESTSGRSVLGKPIYALVSSPSAPGRRICGRKRCARNSDCGEVRTSQGCGDAVCVVQELGSGVFAATGVCMLAQSLMKGRRSSNRLMGRSLLEKKEACACNETHVAESCCSSIEGLVWDTGGKLGELSTHKPINLVE